MLEEYRLEGDVAIIVSQGTGWTKEIASYLNQAGARVIVATGDNAKIKEITADSAAKDILCIPTDVTSSREVENMVERVVSEFGKVDILVNNLNLEVWKPLLDMSEREWHEVIHSNLTPTFLGSRAAGKYMVEQQSGSIVNVISALAERAINNGVAYCTSMGAVLELTRSLALEWARQNVRVNAVGVGWAEKPVAGNEKDLLARYIPSKRRTRAEDVAPLIGFLASKASSFVSGSYYIADGGLMVRA